MKHTQPFILLPASAQNTHSPQTYGQNQANIDAIVRAGGNPVMVVHPDDTALADLLQFVDGIFLAGGHDVDPNEYGEEKKAYTCNIDKDRDRIELALVRIAHKKNIPLLGICRGMQVMNIALGGSLYQDVLEEMPGAVVHDFHYDAGNKPLPRGLYEHVVTLTPGTQFREIAAQEVIEVNSLHHQGIKKLGTGLLPVGLAPDGLIEAIEATNHPFAIGVQWHPEELDDDTSTKLFTAFIAACNAYQCGKNGV
jgi:putative glutamine amidotransferase